MRDQKTINFGLGIFVIILASTLIVPLPLGFAVSSIELSVRQQDDIVILREETIMLSGQKLVVRKMLVNGSESTIFIDEQGKSYSRIEFYAKLAEKEPKLDPELEVMLAQGNLSVIVPVIIIFKDQPLYAVSEEVKQKYHPLLDEQEKQIRNIYKQLRDEYLNDKGYGKYIKNEDPISLYNYESEMLTETDRQIIKESLEASENIKSNMQREICNKIVANTNRAGFVEWIHSFGGRIKAQYTFLNAISADVDLGHVSDIANHPKVATVVKDQVYRLLLDVSPYAIKADTWWNASYTGYPWDIGIIDSGVDDRHPDLDDHGFYAKSFVPGENYDDYHGHGTAIAGIVASTHSNWKGVAYGLDKIINAKAADETGHFTGSAILSAVDWALNSTGKADADVINLSGGEETPYDDTNLARFFDAVVDSLEVPVAVAAGLPDTGVYNPGIAYNIFSVAASDDHLSIDRSDDTLYGNEDRGPTWNQRRKPDITAPGRSIWTTNNNWELNNPDFWFRSGLSCACPHVAAACVLLMDYGILDPMEIKALLINTAERKEIDPSWGGWDKGWGWGYVDLGQAYLHKQDTFTGTIDDEEGNDFKFLKGPMEMGDTVTLVWNRHVQYEGAYPPYRDYDVSDLDLELWEESNGNLIANSYFRRDNIEQVTFESAIPTDVVVKVETFGTFDTGINTENFALATEESFQAVSPPSFVISIDDCNISVGAQFTCIARFENTGDINAHDVEATLNLPPGLTLVSGPNPQTIETIPPGLLGAAVWIVKAEEQGIHPLSVSVESNCYNELFTGTGTSMVIANDAPYTPRTPSGYTSGYTEVSYTYDTSTSDLDGDDVYYTFNWNDDSTKTIGPYASGFNVSTTHIWSFAGVYNVTVQAKDVFGAWSDPSDILTVDITDSGGGGGGGGGETPTFDCGICPWLFVWNGSHYARDFIFDLHGDSDATMCRIIGQSLVPENDHYLLSLRELGETISQIDYVKLYAVDTEGVMHECHLTNAVHSELGNVKQILLCDDDERVDLGPSQTIDFKFNMAEAENTDYFIFEIQGYEPN